MSIYFVFLLLINRLPHVPEEKTEIHVKHRHHPHEDQLDQENPLIIIHQDNLMLDHHVLA